MLISTATAISGGRIRRMTPYHSGEEAESMQEELDVADTTSESDENEPDPASDFGGVK